jgi:putative hydrolase
MIVLFGCEANVLSPDGDLDLTAEILSTLDVVGAGLHERTPYPGDRGLKDNTAALVAACSNPHVDVIVHPYRPRFPIDVDAVAAAAAATGTLLEVNASLFRPLLNVRAAADSEIVQQVKRMLQVLGDYGGRCVVSSDAHHAWELGFEQELIDFLSEVVHLDAELVVSQDAATVTARLAIEADSRS